MASAIGTDLQSRRGEITYKGGGDQPQPLPGQTSAPSNMERLNAFTGLALDNAIRQFDPEWNGGGLTDEQKRAQAITMMNRVDKEIRARAAAFASGAFTAIQCEGPQSAADGSHYSLLVGLIQSTKLDQLAQSMTAAFSEAQTRKILDAPPTDTLAGPRRPQPPA